MQIDVRPAAVHESSDLAGLAARTFALACPPGASPSDISAFIDTHLTAQNFSGYITDPQRQVAVAALDGNIIGYTMLIFEAPSHNVACQLTASPSVELSKLYVDPTHHGGAVARTLFDTAVSCVKDAGAAGIWLGTNQANQRAQRFYEKNGFSQVGTRHFRLGGQWEDDFIYELVL